MFLVDYKIKTPDKRDKCEGVGSLGVIVCA